MDGGHQVTARVTIRMSVDGNDSLPETFDLNFGDITEQEAVLQAHESATEAVRRRLLEKSEKEKRADQATATNVEAIRKLFWGPIARDIVDALRLHRGDCTLDESEAHRRAVHEYEARSFLSRQFSKKPEGKTCQEWGVAVIGDLYLRHDLSAARKFEHEDNMYFEAIFIHPPRGIEVEEVRQKLLELHAQIVAGNLPEVERPFDNRVRDDYGYGW